MTDNRQGFSGALRIGAALAARLQAGFCLLAVAVTALAATDNASTVLERRVKAALLYRFLNYVEWPESAQPPGNAPFTIGIVGADALAAELAEFVAGRTVQNHPLVVRTLRDSELVSDVQVLFVGQTEAAQLGAILRSAPPHALIVSESDESLAQGSIINFLVVDGQVRFDVSLEAARRRGLRLSARLLSVARSVLGAQP